MGFDQVYARYINCDFCGQLTRCRIWDEEPEIMRCGGCHIPLSAGSFINSSENKKEKGGWFPCSKN